MTAVTREVDENRGGGALVRPPMTETGSEQWVDAMFDQEGQKKA